MATKFVRWRASALEACRRSRQGLRGRVDEAVTCDCALMSDVRVASAASKRTPGPSGGIGMRRRRHAVASAASCCLAASMRLRRLPVSLCGGRSCCCGCSSAAGQPQLLAVLERRLRHRAAAAGCCRHQAVHLRFFTWQATPLKQLCRWPHVVNTFRDALAGKTQF